MLSPVGSRTRRIARRTRKHFPHASLQQAANRSPHAVPIARVPLLLLGSVQAARLCERGDRLIDAQQAACRRRTGAAGFDGRDRGREADRWVHSPRSFSPRIAGQAFVSVTSTGGGRLKRAVVITCSHSWHKGLGPTLASGKERSRNVPASMVNVQRGELSREL